MNTGASRPGAPRAPGATTARSRQSSRAQGSTTVRSDTFGTTTGLTNARTRIVGNRDGLLADLIVSTVRSARLIASASRSIALQISAVVTALGRTIICAIPIALVWGYVSGWSELVAVGYTSAVLLLVAGIYLIGRNTFTVTLDLGHSRVVVGEPALGRVSITNPSRYRIFGARAEVPVGSVLAEINLPGLAAGSAFEHEFRIPTMRRGMLTVGPVRTVRADPVGLVRRELTWTGVHELYVHPRTIAIPSTSTGLIRDLEGNPTRDITSRDVSFHALREYAAGDERRNIHWKSTAKTGTYMVRQFEETRRSHLVIALSLASADYASGDEFEMAVSVAGSLGIRAIRDVRNVSVVASAHTPEFAKRKVFAVRTLSTLSPSRLLDELSLVEQAESALGLTDMARVAADQVSGISVVFLVCGSTPTPGELRAASSRFPAGVEVVAVVCDPETVPGLRRVAGLSVLTIGYLQDLKKSLAKAAAS